MRKGRREMTRTRVEGSPGFYALLIWFAAANGYKPLLTILSAAAIHECGHFFALRRCGSRISALRLGICGAVMECDCGRLSYGRELLCVLAGPGANFLTAILCAATGNLWPAFTGANLVLCAFNLLPVRPLDGGRALELLTAWAAGPAAGEYAARWVSASCAIASACALVYVMRESGGSLWFAPLAVGFLITAFRECLGTRSERRI